MCGRYVVTNPVSKTEKIVNQQLGRQYSKL